MDIWVYEVKAAQAVTCLWVVTDGSRAAVGIAVSGHATEREAQLAADRIGGCYESADIMAMVQTGVDYTSAVQAHANRDRRPARVTLVSRVAFYAYKDEATCRRDAAARSAQGESVTVRRYERISGGFTTLHVPHMGRPDHCKVGYATLREAHAAGERNVHGYAVVTEQMTGLERHAESVRMGWA